MTNYCGNPGCELRHASEEELDNLSELMADIHEVSQQIEVIALALGALKDGGVTPDDPHFDEGLSLYAELRHKLWEKAGEYHQSYAHAYGVDLESGDALPRDLLAAMGRL